MIQYNSLQELSNKRVQNNCDSLTKRHTRTTIN